MALFPVVLHELAHGLGFTTMADVKGVIAHDQVDLTPSAFADIGWTLIGNPIFEHGFED